MRCACIDVGANTTRLLVAEPACGSRGEAAGTGACGGLREVAVRRAFTRLGAGRAAAEPVGEARAELLGRAVAHQARESRALGVAHLRVVATAALRYAPDGDAVLAALRAAAPGAAVDMLAPEEEARLAFLGATALLRDPPGGVLGVIDVGGGSTELGVGERGRPPAWSVSLPLGSATLTDGHLPGDPPSQEELGAARASIAAALARAGLAASPGVVGHATAPFPPPVAAYAVGGSASSVRRLAGPALGAGALAAALAVLTAGPAAKVAARHALDHRRVALMPAGILLLEAASGVLGAAPRSCRGGLREGVVLTELTRMGQWGHGQGA